MINVLPLYILRLQTTPVTYSELPESVPHHGCTFGAPTSRVIYLGYSYRIWAVTQNMKGLDRDCDTTWMRCGTFAACVISWIELSHPDSFCGHMGFRIMGIRTQGLTEKNKAKMNWCTVYILLHQPQWTAGESLLKDSYTSLTHGGCLIGFTLC